MRSATWFILVLGFIGIGVGCKPRRVVKPTPAIDSDPNTWIRVRLHYDINSCTVTAPQGFTINGANKFEKASITVDQGQWQLDDRGEPGETILLQPADPYVFAIDGAEYRGRLRLVLRSGRDRFDAFNDLPLESYLAGVVGAEMPAYWEPQALRAQAIASRSYCLHIKERFGRDRQWDMSRSQAHQVYRGRRAESPQVWDALKATSGQILTTHTAEGVYRVYPAYYSSICGGHTENSERVFGADGPLLPGVPCPYCRVVARIGQFYWPMVNLDKEDVERRLARRYPSLKNLGGITDLILTRQSTYPEFIRQTRVELLGANGRKDNLRAEDLRLALDPSGRLIRSTVFQLKDRGQQWSFQQGRGWGHGVGMCQCGAQGMARRGKSAEEILNYYYPDAEIQCLDSK